MQEQRTSSKIASGTFPTLPAMAPLIIHNRFPFKLHCGVGLVRGQSFNPKSTVVIFPRKGYSGRTIKLSYTIAALGLLSTWRYFSKHGEHAQLALGSISLNMCL